MQLHIPKSKKTYPTKVVDDGIGLAVRQQEANANEDDAQFLEWVSPDPTETGASKEQRLIIAKMVHISLTYVHIYVCKYAGAEHPLIPHGMSAAF